MSPPDPSFGTQAGASEFGRGSRVAAAAEEGIRAVLVVAARMMRAAFRNVLEVRGWQRLTRGRAGFDGCRADAEAVFRKPSVLLSVPSVLSSFHLPRQK